MIFSLALIPVVGLLLMIYFCDKKEKEHSYFQISQRDLVDKIRGKKTGIRRLTTLATEGCTNSDIFFICHADAFESAEQLANGIKEKYPNAQVVINQVGPILGNNTGPGALAVIFYGANR